MRIVLALIVVLLATWLPLGPDSSRGPISFQSVTSDESDRIRVLDAGIELAEALPDVAIQRFNSPGAPMACGPASGGFGCYEVEQPVVSIEYDAIAGEGRAPPDSARAFLQMPFRLRLNHIGILAGEIQNDQWHDLQH